MAKAKTTLKVGDRVVLTAKAAKAAYKAGVTFYQGNVGTIKGPAPDAPEDFLVYWDRPGRTGGHTTYQRPDELILAK